MRDAKVGLIAGWVALVPVWIAIYFTIGSRDKIFGFMVGNWILLFPGLLTLSWAILTLWCRKVWMRE